MSISANCLVVVITSIFAWILVSQGIDVITLTGEVDQGLPAWQLPWHFNRNTTEEWEEGPVELAQEFGMGLLMLPLVSILQHLAIAKHYAGHKPMAASQEMLALGVSQMVGAFTGSMVVTASFGRWVERHMAHQPVQVRCQPHLGREEPAGGRLHRHHHHPRLRLPQSLPCLHPHPRPLSCHHLCHVLHHQLHNRQRVVEV